MRKKIQKLIVLLLTALLMFTGCRGNKTNDSSTGEDSTILNNDTANNNVKDNGLAKSIENGAILHCWSWSFNTIKENLSEIAAAGFTSIQTSPISQCLVGENGGMEIYGAGKWYFHYQPTKYVIGNYQMGTEAEFSAMCEEAHKYGINVIVDTVINHCTSEYDSIDASLTEIEGGGFHAQDGNWSETDRFEETQYALSGLWDLNTQNENVQQLVKKFLESCVAAGADGFRYDAAKLIELPDDTSSKYSDFASDFWPVVLDNGAAWQYGEVLQEGGAITYSDSFTGGYDDSVSSRLSAYQKYMSTTNSMYGWRIRDAVNNNNLSTDFIADYLLPQGASSEKVVTWVESHDNYCNDASYTELDTQEVIEAWAVIAARKDGTPLFFDRPAGSTESNPWGENVLGAAGSNMYKDAQVVAVNFFRNEMGDAQEYLSNLNGNKEVLMIERGTAGAVIVNSSDEDIVIDGAAVQSMADGTYTDQAFGGEFTVKDGKISGTVKAGKVAVVYNPQSEGLTFKPSIESSMMSGYFLTDSVDVTLTFRGCDKAVYTINDSDATEFKNGDIVTLGKDAKVGDSIKLVLTGTDESGNKIREEYTYDKKQAAGNTVVYFDVNAMPSWNGGKVNVYIYNGDATVTNGSWPGVEMEDTGNGIYKYILPFELEESSSNVIFNNGNGGDGNQYPTAAGLVLDPGKQMIYNSGGQWTEYK